MNSIVSAEVDESIQLKIQAPGKHSWRAEEVGETYLI